MDSGPDDIDFDLEHLTFGAEEANRLGLEMEARYLGLSQQVLAAVQAHNIQIPEGISADGVSTQQVTEANFHPELHELYAFMGNLDAVVRILEGSEQIDTAIGRIAFSDLEDDEQMKWLRVLEDVTARPILWDSNEDNQLRLAAYRQVYEAQMLLETEASRKLSAVRQEIEGRLVALCGEHDDLADLSAAILQSAYGLEGLENLETEHLNADQLYELVAWTKEQLGRSD